jgi:DNA-directed RNA polymerase subunit L
MLKVNKTSLKVLNKETELGNSRLEFKISGPNVDYIVANTIRRTIMADVPIYAFGEFKFEKNSSVFHNNYIKLRLKHMPVWTIENSVDFLEKIKAVPSTFNDMETIGEENDEDGDKVQLEVEKTLNSSTLKQLTMYINTKNKTNEIVTVTTNDAKFYYDEKQITSPYKVPIPIVKLQPGQEIAFSAITKIGTEEEDTMFTPICICVYKQVNNNEFDFVIESRGQIIEKRIVQVALINIERKLRNFNKLLTENKATTEPEDKQSGLIIVNNEDHTLGNLISRGMQQHSKVSFAGYNLPHPLGKKVNFHYKLESNGEIKSVINDVVDYYSEVFSQIKKSIDTF